MGTWDRKSIAFHFSILRVSCAISGRRQSLYIRLPGSLLHTLARGAVERGAWSTGYRPAVGRQGLGLACSAPAVSARFSSSGSVGIARVVGLAYGYRGWVASLPAAHRCVSWCLAGVLLREIHGDVTVGIRATLRSKMKHRCVCVYVMREEKKLFQPAFKFVQGVFAPAFGLWREPRDSVWGKACGSGRQHARREKRERTWSATSTQNEQTGKKKASQYFWEKTSPYGSFFFFLGLEFFFNNTPASTFFFNAIWGRVFFPAFWRVGWRARTSAGCFLSLSGASGPKGPWWDCTVGAVGIAYCAGGCSAGMYAKCGALLQAQRVLQKLPSRKVVGWIALIAGYAYTWARPASSQLFRTHAAPGDPFHWSALCVCAATRAFNKGKEVHDAISRQGSPDIESSALFFLIIPPRCVQQSVVHFRVLDARVLLDQRVIRYVSRFTCKQHAKYWLTVKAQ